MSKWLMIYDESYIKVMEIIRKKRKKLYTQKEFAEIMGVTQKTISCYESCQTELNLKQFIKICHLLDIDFISCIYLNLEEEYEKI